MPTIKAKIKDAEKVKKELIKLDVLDPDRSPTKEEEHIYFPVLHMPSGYEEIDKELPEKDKLPTFKETASKYLNKKEVELLNTAYDTAGTIAIVDIPEELETKKKEIGKALLESNPRLKTATKRGLHEGEYRTQKLEILAGENTKETIISENGVRLKTNLETVYFSVRLSTERKRIAEYVMKGERILVMFSGAGPYVCTLSKNTEAKEIVGVEINPEGHKYAEENVKMNKLNNVKLHCGDVKEIVPKLGQFDRILMPLPKSADDFLDTAIKATKQGSIIHFYYFLHEDSFEEAEKLCKKACEKARKKYEKLSLNKCGQYSPGHYRICLDFKITHQ